MLLSHKPNSRDKPVNMKRVIIKFNRKKSWIEEKGMGFIRRKKKTMDYSQWKNERTQNNGSNTSVITLRY